MQDKPLLPMHRKEVCEVLKISRDTLTSWLLTAGVITEDTRHKKILTPAQLKRFFEHIGFEYQKM
jgi:phage antirepressor YoqD-like protein